MSGDSFITLYRGGKSCKCDLDQVAIMKNAGWSDVDGPAKTDEGGELSDIEKKALAKKAADEEKARKKAEGAGA